MTKKPSIFFISGARSSGKTTFCTQIASLLPSAGWDVAGILSVPIFERSEQIAKEAVDIRSGTRRNLANINLEPTSTSAIQTGRWIFDRSTIDWCNELFRASIPCDCLVIDEIGPLEFNQSQGFLEALAALDSGEFSVAFAVIRPALLATAQQRWPKSAIIEFTDQDNPEQQAFQMARKMGSKHPSES